MDTKPAIILFTAAILILGPISVTAEEPAQPLMPQSIADVVETVRPSFVNILVKGIVTPESTEGAKVPHMTDIVGSGVIVDASGIIFTNNHVVDNAYELRVQLSNGMILPARLLGKGKQLDVAFPRPSYSAAILRSGYVQRTSVRAANSRISALGANSNGSFNVFHTSTRASTSSAICASLCIGEGVMRSRSVPRATVG